MVKSDWFGYKVFRSRRKVIRSAFYPLFWWLCKEKLALPSSFCCFAVAGAGVPDCALFATLELCRYGRVRVREGVSGKRRDRRLSVVKGVVWHLVCLMFCASPPPPPLEEKHVYTVWGVFAEGEFVRVMVRVSEFWVVGR